MLIGDNKGVPRNGTALPWSALLPPDLHLVHYKGIPLIPLTVFHLQQVLPQKAKGAYVKVLKQREHTVNFRLLVPSWKNEELHWPIKFTVLGDVSIYCSLHLIGQFDFYFSVIRQATWNHCTTTEARQDNWFRRVEVGKHPKHSPTQHTNKTMNVIINHTHQQSNWKWSTGVLSHTSMNTLSSPMCTSYVYSHRELYAHLATCTQTVHSVHMPHRHTHIPHTVHRHTQTHTVHTHTHTNIHSTQYTHTH